MLKSEQGFVGYKAGGTKLECNKATYETIHVERGDRGKVSFKGQSRGGRGRGTCVSGGRGQRHPLITTYGYRLGQVTDVAVEH